MKKVLLIIVASVFSFSTAMADVMVSAGLSYNQSVFAAEGRERNYDYVGTINTDITEYGAFEESYASVFAEVGNGIVGLGVSYVPSAISTPSNDSEQTQHADGTTSVESVSAEFKDLTTLYAIARLPVWGVYIKAGMSKVDVDVTETNTSANYQDTDTDGITYGIGIEKELGAVGIRAEIMGHEFDSVSANNGKAAGAADANVIDVTDMIGATATISIVKNF